MSSLEARIDRLESLDAIRQLPAKYSLCLDMRDMDMMVTLFEPNVRVGRDQSGRKALRAYMDGTLRAPFTGTSHHIGGHIIEFDDPDQCLAQCVCMSVRLVFQVGSGIEYPGGRTPAPKVTPTGWSLRRHPVQGGRGGFGGPGPWGW